MEIAKTIGNILRKLRSEKEMKQADIAEILHISSSTYSNYERGANIPEISLLIKLAEYYHVTIDYLVGFSKIRKSGGTMIETSNGGISIKDISLLNDENREVVRIIVQALKREEESKK